MINSEIFEDEIVSGCINQDRKAQKRLFEMYYSDMLSVCMRYISDEDSAKDILQEGFIKVFSKIGTYTGSGSLRGWIHTTMVRTALDQYRKIRRDAIVEYESETDTREQATIESDITAEEILKLMYKLPDLQRIIFNLFALEGYSHRDIGEELGITEGTSKWYLCEARKSLRKLIEIYYPVKEKVEYATQTRFR